MFGPLSARPRISIVQASNLTRLKAYPVISAESNSEALHSHGALYRLLKNPTAYNPTTFGLCRIQTKPVAIASLTRNVPVVGNLKGYQLLSKPCDLCADTPISFPNIEMMAYTNFEYRGQGLGSKTISRLLHLENVPEDALIYVYSMRMERILSKLGYYKTVNLHEYTP
jgi:hypothetical protein